MLILSAPVKKLTSTQSDNSTHDAFLHECGRPTAVERFQRSTETVNRTWLLSQLQSMQTRSEREQKCGAVLSLNIGVAPEYDVTATLPWQIDQHLVRCVSGYTVVALGNAEFAVLLDNLDRLYLEAAVEANKVAQQILIEFGQPLHLNQLEITCSPSIVILVFDRTPMPASTLLGNARFAMYEAIAAGGNATRFYDPILAECLDLHEELKAGLASGQFVLEFKPLSEIEDEPAGFEARLQWRHPQYGTLLHGELLELGQRAGMGHVLSLWALTQTCANLLRWRQDLSPAFSVTVEVSAMAFERGDFIDELMTLIENVDVSAGRLKLRINEKIVTSNAIIEKINRLGGVGIEVLLGH